MLIYRVEHHETCSGPFQSEFYPADIALTFRPHGWGAYLPSCGEEYHDQMYDFGASNRRWGCYRKYDIEVIETSEAEELARNGWIVRVYEVPESCVFKGSSLKQCIFDYACAVLLLTLDLLQFILGKEVEYVPIPA